MRAVGMRGGDLFAGRFEIDRLAGSGGMGDVYRAIDRDAGSAVALKVLRVDAGASERFEAWFAHEGEVLARLQHPSIVRHVAHGVAPSGELYLAMEWLEGEDLAARIGRGRLSPDEAVAVARRTAGALAAA